MPRVLWSGPIRKPSQPVKNMCREGGRGLAQAGLPENPVQLELFRDLLVGFVGFVVGFLVDLPTKSRTFSCRLDNCRNRERRVHQNTLYFLGCPDKALRRSPQLSVLRPRPRLRGGASQTSVGVVPGALELVSFAFGFRGIGKPKMDTPPKLGVFLKETRPSGCDVFGGLGVQVPFLLTRGRLPIRS